MHEIYELKEMLCKELEEYGRKGEISTGTLEVVDKLAHTVKNLGKIIEMGEEEGYSGNYDYERGGNRGGSYARRGGSYVYARGDNRGRGSNARRDSMGRYASEGGYSREDGIEEMVETVRSMMHELPQNIQRDAQKFVEKLEQQM